MTLTSRHLQFEVERLAYECARDKGNKELEMQFVKLKQQAWTQGVPKATIKREQLKGEARAGKEIS